MESKALDSVLRTTEVQGNTMDEMQVGDRKKKTEEGYGNKEVELKRNYDAISKDGDTLEISKDGKKMGDNPNMANPSLSAKNIVSTSGKKIPNSILAGYSEAKLKQLYANKEISKQQYDSVTKKKKAN